MSEGGTRPRLLGLLLVLSVVFVLAEAVAASGWTGGPYSWTGQAISELGRTDCTTGWDGALACSPRHVVLNGTLVLTALRVLAALVVGLPLLRAVASSATRVVVVALTVLYALGMVLVALSPLSTSMSGLGSGGHGLGALLAIGGGVVLLAAIGHALRESHLRAALLALACAVAGGLALVAAMTGTGPFGLVERAAVYAPILWQVVVGSALLVRPEVARWRA